MVCPAQGRVWPPQQRSLRPSRLCPVMLTSTTCPVSRYVTSTRPRLSKHAGSPRGCPLAGAVHRAGGGVSNRARRKCAEVFGDGNVQQPLRRHRSRGRAWTWQVLQEGAGVPGEGGHDFLRAEPDCMCAVFVYALARARCLSAGAHLLSPQRQVSSPAAAILCLKPMRKVCFYARFDPRLWPFAGGSRREKERE